VYEAGANERVSHCLGITAFAQTKNGHDFRCHVVELALAGFDCRLGQKLLVVLSHEVEPSALHEQFFASEARVLLVLVVAVLLALIGHRVGALSSRPPHNALCLSKQSFGSIQGSQSQDPD